MTIDNWRWAGVPFYLRTGKALGIKRTEVAIKFKQAPFAMFSDTPVDRLSQNYLVISIEPTEGITLQFNTKVPGPTISIDGVEMKFRYKDYFKAEPSTGYETLIYDCMIGDNILFQRADSVEAGWQAVQPFLDAWKKAGANGLESYQAGSEGPAEADALLDARRPKLAKADLTWHRAILVRQDPGIRCCRSGRAGKSRRGSPDRQDHRQRRSRGDLPHRRLKPEAAVSNCLRPSAYRSRIPWDRVHWFIGDERFVPRDRSAQQHGDGAHGCSWTAARRRPISIRSPTDTADPKEAARRYESELKSFYGARPVSILPGRCSMSC